VRPSNEDSFMKNKLFLLTLTLLLFICVAMAEEKPFSGGIIPDEQTAIAVAEAILFRAYGKRNIESQRPYKVSLTDGEWYIFGTLPEDPIGPVFGGVFRIVISQKDGRVRSVGHGE
jgi:NTF2 fold immunity protein